MGSSLTEPMVSGVMYRARWVAPSSDCSGRMAPMVGRTASNGAGSLVRTDADDIGAALGLAIQALDRVGAMECDSAWNRDPLGGVIGVQKGPL